MALLYQRDEIGFERTGEVTTVPDNDVARLMYYLNCVCVAIECGHDRDIQRFTNYRNWASLSFEGQKALLVVCYAFSPDVLDDRVFFHSDALCGDYGNDFFTINQVRNQLIASESIVIAGQVREVNKIMTYKMSWMRKNYFEPMERLARRITAPPRPAVTYGSIYTPSVVRQPVIYQSSSTSRCTTTRRWCIVICVIFILFGIIRGIIAIIDALKK